MATVPLMDVLGAPQLIGAIQGVKSGIPDVFPKGFYNVDKTVARDYGTYTRVNGNRKTARLVAYGAPSVTRELTGVEEVPVKLMHTAENINFAMSDFRGILQRASTSSNLMIDNKGVQEIGRQVALARKNIDNLRVSALTSAIALGAIYFDGKGNLLPTSSGAKTTIDYGVPAGNKTQLDILGAGSILTTGWNTTTASIDTQIMAFKTAALQLTGYEPRYAFYGKNVPGFLTRNTTLKEYFVRSGAFNGQYLSSGDIPNPLLGLTWLPAYQHFFEDQNGVVKTIIGDNEVVFTPEPDLDWIGWLEGTYDVPTSMTVAGDAVAALGNIMAVSGDFAYATLVLDPLSIKMVYGSTFLPVIKVPKAVFMATVSF